ncbi:MAG: ATP-binding protein [Candidatus Methylomirabilota bacterium]
MTSAEGTKDSRNLNEAATGGLAEWQRFESFLVDLSPAFVNLPAHQVDEEITRWLERIVRFLDIDRSTLFQSAGEGLGFRITHSWAMPGFSPAPSIAAQELFPWAWGMLLRGEPFVCARVEDLPAEAERDKKSLREWKVRSSLAVPLMVAGSVIGALSIGSLRHERPWPCELVQRLQLVGQVFANAVQRKRADEAIRKSEARFRRALEAAPDGVLLVRPDGAIVVANEQAGRIFGYDPEDLIGLHVEELVPGRFRSAHGHQRQEFVQSGASREIGMRQNLSGLRKDGTEFPVEIGLSPLETPEGLLVYCSVRDVTERRRLAAEMRRLRMELWHAERVARTGTFSASLAHELNQPLAAILSNAQAALRFLARDNPDLGEIRQILTDIVRDDKRAGAVISGLRSMLRRQEPERVRVELAGTLREVLVLLHSELLTHQVEVTANFEAGCTVLADKAQLQQVVLNLVMNAIQAMQGRPAGERHLALSAWRAGEGEVRVAVRDAGVGIPEENLATVFEPFWTTKGQGMGLGLAVCRAIVESHEGAIWVEANQDRGVTFLFRLPANSTEASEPDAPGPGADCD